MMNSLRIRHWTKMRIDLLLEDKQLSKYQRDASYILMLWQDKVRSSSELDIVQVK